jgi:glycine cleavage system H protein
MGIERQIMYQEEYPVIPESERKCVWMTSGMISYKLCPQDYACEECMFDRVMRNESAAMIRRPDVDAALAADLASIDSLTPLIDGSLFYHRNHCWVKVINQDEAKIGINGILSRLLYGIKAVVLPKVGEVVSREQFSAHIIQEKHIVPLILPVNGVIKRVNQALLKTPDLLRNDSLDKGWLVTIKPDNLENDLRTLKFGTTAIEWYRNKDRQVSETMHAVFSVTDVDIGHTMQDGGEFLLNPSELLSPDQYYHILEVLFRSE